MCACVGEMGAEKGDTWSAGLCEAVRPRLSFSFFALRREERRPNVYIRGRSPSVRLALFEALWICQDSFPVIGCEDSSFSKINSVVYVLGCSARGLRSLVKLGTLFPFFFEVLGFAYAAGVAAISSNFLDNALGSLFRRPVFGSRQRTRIAESDVFLWWC